VFVEDEYGEYDAEYVLAPPDEAGGFSVEVVVGGSVTGRDGDGRVYLIWAVAVDGFGNETASDSVTATASNPARGRGQGNGGGNGNGNGNGNGPRK